MLRPSRLRSLARRFWRAPISAEVSRFAGAHSALVSEEALKLTDKPKVVHALSYLYAAKTIHLAILSRNPLSDEAQRLGSRATELGIDIPNTYDICGSGDAVECIRTIGKFAIKYRDEALSRRGGGTEEVTGSTMNLRDELRTGYKSARLKTPRDSLVRATQIGGAIVVAFLVPFPWWGKILVFLSVMLVIWFFVQLRIIRRGRS